MTEKSKIAWTRSTWNPWRGCSEIAEGCRNCYAEALSRRNPDVLGTWGPTGTRVVASEEQWNEPGRWNKRAARGGPGDVPWYVFCASLADVFEDYVGQMKHYSGVRLWRMHEPNGHVKQWGAGVVLDEPDSGRPLTMRDVRERVFETWLATPHLRWLVLTKRPGNILRMLGGRGFSNVMFGTSAATQDDVDRNLPLLLDVKRADVCAGVFLSAEPQIERITLDHDYDPAVRLTRRWLGPGGLDWVICGGESGPYCREFQATWAASLADECRRCETPFFFKQMGGRGRHGGMTEGWPRHITPVANQKGELLGFRAGKGDDPSEWPERLNVREYPRCFDARTSA